MKHPLEDVSEWLKSHENQRLIIEKQELGDLDKIQMDLEFIGYADENNCSIDDYIACKALLLHGGGTILTDETEAALPGGTFTVPVEGLSHAEIRDDHLKIETERGQYTFTVQPPPSFTP